MSVETLLGSNPDPSQLQLYPSLPVLIAGDGPGASLYVRSSNNPQKGAVIFDEITQSYSATSGAVQVVGGMGMQGNLYIGGQQYVIPGYQGVGTITIAAAGVGYLSNPTVTISNPAIANGITTQALALATTTAGGVATVIVGNPGFGYNTVPTVTISDPFPTQNIYIPGATYSTGTLLKVQTTNGSFNIYNVQAAGTVSATAPSTTAYQATLSGTTANTTTLTFSASVAGNGIQVGSYVFGITDAVTYQPTYAIVTATGTTTLTVNKPVNQTGSATATFTNITFTSGTATLAYMGSTATALASLGTTSLIQNGTITGVGGVTSVYVSAGGSGFVQDQSRITFSSPPFPAGRTAQGYLTISGGAITAVNIVDPGSGYIVPPTYTISGPGLGTILIPIIGNGGVRPIVGANTTALTASSTVSLDFGLNGHSYVYLTSGSNFNLSLGTTNGFPQGRQVTVAVKATAGITVTLNGTAANNNKGSNSISVTNGTTAWFAFTVMTNGNSTSDVYANITTS
jgi:hypothetical protein